MTFELHDLPIEIVYEVISFVPEYGYLTCNYLHSRAMISGYSAYADYGRFIIVNGLSKFSRFDSKTIMLLILNIVNCSSAPISYPGYTDNSLYLYRTLPLDSVLGFEPLRTELRCMIDKIVTGIEVCKSYTDFEPIEYCTKKAVNGILDTFRKDRKLFIDTDKCLVVIGRKVHEIFCRRIIRVDATKLSYKDYLWPVSTQIFNTIVDAWICCSMFYCDIISKGDLHKILRRIIRGTKYGLTVLTRIIVCFRNNYTLISHIKESHKDFMLSALRHILDDDGLIYKYLRGDDQRLLEIIDITGIDGLTRKDVRKHPSLLKLFKTLSSEYR